MKPFNSTEHKIEYFGEGLSKIPVKIDGKCFHANDFDIPYREVTELHIIYRNADYKLDHSNMFDMWHSSSKINERFLLTCRKNNCLLEGIFGDGVGTFMASWQFGDGKSVRTELGADENKMLPLIYRLKENIGDGSDGSI